MIMQEANHRHEEITSAKHDQRINKKVRIPRGQETMESGDAISSVDQYKHFFLSL